MTQLRKVSQLKNILGGGGMETTQPGGGGETTSSDVDRVHCTCSARGSADLDASGQQHWCYNYCESGASYGKCSCSPI